MDSSILNRLSPEVRNVVYEYVFASKYAITLRPGVVQHPLTKTCRRIRSETLAMYYASTRFNAHLDDGPATPLGEWLKNQGPNLASMVDEINIWDMHMLNGTLHGKEATQRLLKQGPPLEDIGPSEEHQAAGPWSKASVDIPEANPTQAYVLRPIGNWVFNRGWYLKDIILALHSMGLGLARFCITDKTCPEGGEGRVKLTSEFAIVSLDSHDEVQGCSSDKEGSVFQDSYTEVNSLAKQFGLSGKARESLILHLAAGERTVILREGHRKLVLEFDPKGRHRLSSMRQEFTGESMQDADWASFGAMESGLD